MPSLIDAQVGGDQDQDRLPEGWMPPASWIEAEAIAFREELEQKARQVAELIAESYATELNFFGTANQQVLLHANAEQMAATKAEFAADHKKLFGYAFDGHLPAACQEKLDLSEFLGEQKSLAAKSLWRIGASVTAFQVQDRDPNAVDQGALLGLQFDIMRHGQFTAAYRIFLNRAFSTEGTNRPFTIQPTQKDEATYLRVHRHTIPGGAAGINMATLAAKYLPSPEAIRERPDGTVIRREQDLKGFVDTVRQHLVAYHNRLAIVADERRQYGVGNHSQKPNPNNSRKRKEPEHKAPAEDEPNAKRRAGDRAFITKPGPSKLGPSNASLASAAYAKPSSSKADEAAAAAGKLAANKVPVDKVNDTISKRVIDMRVTDAEAKLVEVAFQDETTLKMALNDDGKVEKVLADKPFPDMDAYNHIRKDFKKPEDFSEVMVKIHKLFDIIDKEKSAQGEDDSGREADAGRDGEAGPSGSG